jgi:hypothetical protein
MMWAIIGYVVGMILTIGALFLFLARLASFFDYLERRLPPWLDDLVDFDGEIPAEVVTSFFALGVLFASVAGRDPSHAGPLDYLAIVAGIINLSILGLWLAVFVIFVVWFLIIWPLIFFEEIRGRPVERVTNAILLITASYIVIAGASALSAAAIDRFVVRAPEWLVHAAWIVLVYGLPLIAMLGVAALSLRALGHGLRALGRAIVILPGILAAMIARAVRPRPARAPWNDENISAQGDSLAERARDRAQSAISDVAVALGSVGNNGGRPVFRGGDRRARQVATQRENFVHQRLREYRHSLPTQEILEVPPGFSESIMRRELDEPSAEARLTTLLYQSAQEEALLFGRLIDAIRCFIRERSLRSPGLPSLAGTELVLRRLRWWERRRGEYPWVALVRTQHTREFAAFLEPLREWLGIGVRIAAPVGWRLQRSCVYSDELGTVAGYVATSDPAVKYALTCAHVLPERCSQTRLTRSGKSSGDQPDAALLLQHPCVETAQTGVRACFVSRRVLRRLWIEKTTVYRAGGHSPHVTGYVKNEQASYVKPDNSVEAFPACVVQTKRVRYAWGLLPWPPIRRRFSEHGDSGSWVMIRSAQGPSLWLGMVVAGGEGDDKMESYVIKASALKQYFRRRLSRERPIVSYVTENF